MKSVFFFCKCQKWTIIGFLSLLNSIMSYDFTKPSDIVMD
jgi:hypothetical protein